MSSSRLSRRAWPATAFRSLLVTGSPSTSMRLAAHFGQWLHQSRRGRNVPQWQVAAGLIYGQVKNSYRRRKLVRVSHVMRLGVSRRSQSLFTGDGLLRPVEHRFYRAGESDHPAWNSRMARRTWATSQQTPQLLAHLEWWRGYYHFVRPHDSLRIALLQPRERGGKRLAQRYRQRTPAMAAGKTNRRCTAREVLSCPLPPASA